MACRSVNIQILSTLRNIDIFSKVTTPFLFFLYQSLMYPLAHLYRPHTRPVVVQGPVPLKFLPHQERPFLVSQFIDFSSFLFSQ